MNKSDRLGKVSLIVSGILFFLVGILDFFAHQPPSQGLEIVSWASVSKTYLVFSNELLFFAIVFMIPAVRLLKIMLIKSKVNDASFGCSLMTAVIPLWAALLVIQGRLVFPIFDIHLIPATAELLVSLWYGGLHVVYELMAAAMILVSLDLRKVIMKKGFMYFGITMGATTLAGGYPWLIGPIPMLISQSLFGMWFLVVGVMIYKVDLK